MGIQVIRTNIAVNLSMHECRFTCLPCKICTSSFSVILAALAQS